MSIGYVTFQRALQNSGIKTMFLGQTKPVHVIKEKVKANLKPAWRSRKFRNFLTNRILVLNIYIDGKKQPIA